MDLLEVGGGMDWIDLAQYKDRWRAVAYAGFRKMRGICGLAEDVITGQTGTRTPPREYNAWWSQETLSVYQLVDKKDICG